VGWGEPLLRTKSGEKNVDGRGETLRAGPGAKNEKGVTNGHEGEWHGVAEIEDSTQKGAKGKKLYNGSVQMKNSEP